MNTKDIIEYCKKWGVGVDRSQASRWLKEYEGGGGTKSLIVLMRIMVSEVSKNISPPVSSLIAAPAIPIVRRKSSTKTFIEKAEEEFLAANKRMSDKIDALPVIKKSNFTPAPLSGVDQIRPGMVRNDKGWWVADPSAKSEKKTVDEVKLIEPQEVGRAESVPNGWKFDPALRKTGFVWNEVIYNHKGFLEVGTVVKLDGLVELGVGGSLIEKS